MVVFGVGVNEVLNVHSVDKKFAQAKLEECHHIHFKLFERLRLVYLIPVVTATCPNRLNQPVIQDANGA